MGYREPMLPARDIREDEAARAVRYVCGAANDAADARELLSALGLQP